MAGICTPGPTRFRIEFCRTSGRCSGFSRTLQRSISGSAIQIFSRKKVQNIIFFAKICVMFFFAFFVAAKSIIRINQSQNVRGQTLLLVGKRMKKYTVVVLVFFVVRKYYPIGPISVLQLFNFANFTKIFSQLQQKNNSLIVQLCDQQCQKQLSYFCLSCKDTTVFKIHCDFFVLSRVQFLTFFVICGTLPQLKFWTHLY